MLINKNLILNKRNIARTLYAQLHDLEKTLNRYLKSFCFFIINKFYSFSYLKYPCNGESFSLANSIRIVYEYATGCRLNPILSKKSTDSILNRSRQHTIVPIHASHISNEELHFIQNTLPIWLTEIENKCSSK
jgi:hypothetical protein